MIIKFYNIIIALLFSTIVFAQKGLNFSLIIQPSTSFISGSWIVPELKMDSDHYESPKKFTFGFEAGIKGSYNFNDNIGINLGLIYSQQGQKFGDYTYNVTNITYERKIRLSYLKIPLELNFTLKPDKDITIISYLGIYYGILIDYIDETIRTNNNYENTFETFTVKNNDISLISTTNNNPFIVVMSNLSENIYRNDYGIVVGTGVQKKISSSMYLMFMLKFEKGLNDIRNLSSQYLSSGGSPYYSDVKVSNNTVRKNSILGLTIGMKKSF